MEGRGKEVNGRCGAVCQPYVLWPSRPSPLPLPTPRARRLQRVAGAHVAQRGEGAELRGQGAAQAVVVKVPARERSISVG